MNHSIVARRQFVSREVPAHLETLRDFCLNLAKNDAVADDLVQSTCLMALENAAQFEPGTHLDIWLCTIARNVWINEQRRLSRSPSDSVSIDSLEMPSSLPSAEIYLFGSEIMEKIWALPTEERDAVRLIHIEELSFKYAAVIMGLSVGTVANRLAAVRDKLSKATGDFWPI